MLSLKWDQIYGISQVAKHQNLNQLISNSNCYAITKESASIPHGVCYVPVPIL